MFKKLINFLIEIVKVFIKNIIDIMLYLSYRFLSIKNNSLELSIEDLIKNHSICTSAPLHGNFAFPDFYSIYIITFLPPHQKISYIKLKDLVKENYNIFSVTFYDSSGKINEYYDDNIDSKEYITHNYCVSIIRIYSVNPINTLDSLIKEHNIKFDIIKKNTKYFTYFYNKLINLKKINIDKSINEFHFSKENLSLFFTNHRARYLILPIKDINQTIIITAKKPDCGINKSIRYFAFMTCNLSTTETDNCINYDDLEDEYTIFVVKSDNNSIINKYDRNNKSHKILLWKSSNDNPVLVYREIRIDNEGLFSLNKNASIDEIKKIMGKNYPKAIIIDNTT